VTNKIDFWKHISISGLTFKRLNVVQMGDRRVWKSQINNTTALARQRRHGQQPWFATAPRNEHHMRSVRLKEIAGFLAIALWSANMGIGRAQVTVSPANFTVTTPGSEFEFVVNGASSGQPQQDGNVDDSLNFTLNAGATYIFSMDTAAEHPVDICTNPTTSSHYSGASAQAVNAGTVTLTIPATNYPTTLYYICNFHTFYGVITVGPPKAPPVANILQTSVTTNIVLTFSGGTNTIQLIPQFSSNLVSGDWQPVPSYTNTFSGNGTNTTSFERLDAICGPDVFLRISQAPN
jgi:hypothetical protein